MVVVRSIFVLAGVDVLRVERTVSTQFGGGGGGRACARVDAAAEDRRSAAQAAAELENHSFHGSVAGSMTDIETEYYQRAF